MSKKTIKAVSLVLAVVMIVTMVVGWFAVLGSN